MKILGQMLFAVLLSTVSVYGQQQLQNASEFTDTVKETNQRPAEIIEEPTILGAGKTWAVISWTTNASGKGRSKIYAGTDPKNLKPANETPALNGKDDRVPSYAVQEYAHLVRLNNLKPGTTYYFKADSSNKTNRGAESQSHTWTFATLPHESRSVHKTAQVAGMPSIAKPAAKTFLAQNHTPSNDTRQRQHSLATSGSMYARLSKSAPKRHQAS